MAFDMVIMKHDLIMKIERKLPPVFSLIEKVGWDTFTEREIRFLTAGCEIVLYRLL
ncbi:MAG TPA: hypothetical protein VK136_09025 [Bacillota bacterium]|nr:hypothetical protein [Bacillota bacterium]